MNFSSSQRRVPSVFTWAKLAGMALVILLLAALASAQSTGTVTGTVTDQSGAVVAKAKVTLHNEGVGDNRETVSNDSGYFSFATVSPGSYTVKVTAANFKSFERKGLSVLPGDVRDVRDIALQVGASSDVIEVQGVADEIAPVDSGERSAVLTSKQIQNLALEGRDATELIRTLPGFVAYNGGSVNNQAQDFTVISPTGGAVGQGYVGNGAQYRGGSDLTLDSAHILDNGCNCGATTTVNGDMVAEVKVQTSNFGADSAKGPVVVNAVGKSGTSTYHGEAYLYARDQTLNSLDWSFKHQMINNNASSPLKISPPPSKFLYPGVQFGGPVPGTNKKLVFHTAYEYYHQAGLPTSTGGAVSGLVTDTVPTLSMRNGIFDVNPTVAADNAAFCTSGGNMNSSICQGTYNTSATFTGTNLPAPGTSKLQYVDLSGTLHTNVMAPIATPYDLGGSIIMGNLPAPNANPSVTGGYNFILPETVDQNGWMWRTRADYNASENTKFYATYQEQKEVDNVPIHLWWQPTNSIPFPGGMSSKDNSQTISGHFVKIINPTLTNDASGALGYINYPLTRTSASAWARSTGGTAGLGAYPYADGPFPSTSLMMPQLNDTWTAGMPAMNQPDIFSSGGHFVWQKWNLSFEDSVTKSFKTHTIKGGFYYERTVNNQGAFTDYDGNFSPQSSGTGGAGSVMTNCYNGSTQCGSDNIALSLLLGAGGFDQINKSGLDNLWYPTYSGYVQDDWKATKRLTLNLGLRADHLGAWTPPTSLGILSYTGNANSTPIPDFTWHGATSSIPVPGRTVAAITWEPRLGMALDLRGNGKTVLRGGWGEYGYRDQWNDYAGPADTPQGVLQYNNSFPISLSFAQGFGISGGGGLPTVGCGHIVSGSASCGSITGQALTDHKQPLSRNYNFTISQQAPWSSLLEVGYVGSEGINGQIENSPQNINVVQQGVVLANAGCSALQASNPASVPTTNCNLSSTPVNLFPFGQDYGSNAVNVLRHLATSNYNALQISWARQKGRINYNLNYTWSKALGTQGAGGGAGSGLAPDATNLAHDYGVLGIDRSHAVNLSYVLQGGNPVHGDYSWSDQPADTVLGYLVNGWNLSGITTWQSGPDVVELSSTNLNLNGNGPSYFDPSTGATGANCQTIGGGTCGVYNFNTLTYAGSPNMNLQPTVICNPTANLKPHQYFNAACFSGPTAGANGQWQLPYVHGPSYFNSDLALFKTFKVTERQNVEFRLSAFNFLNHPLDSFQNNGDMQLNMNYQCNGAAASSTNYCPLGSGAYVVTNVPTGTYNLTGSNIKSGYASTRFGRRVLEVSAKYNF
jgi:Carboxypeptidase regulatory-like domain